jgi:hypothetical protein
LLGGFLAYSGERWKWKAFQKRLAHPTSDLFPPPERRVEMPEPAAILPAQAVLGGQRTLLGFGAPTAVLIWGTGAGVSAWSQFLFIWPPNEALQWTILGTSIAVAILAAIIVWRKMTPKPTVFNDLGITTPARSSRQLIPWSEMRLRHLLLIPVVTPEGKHVTHATELYRIMTDDPEPLEFATALDDGQRYMVLFERENKRVHAAIALAMHRTGLPLIANAEALQQREALLDIGKVSQARRRQYLNAALVVTFFLAIAIAVSVSFLSHATYLTVTGMLASYERASSKVAIRVVGDPTTYALSVETASGRIRQKHCQQEHW